MATMSPARLTSAPHGWEPLPMSSMRGRQQPQSPQQLASSFSSPALVQLSGTSLFCQAAASWTTPAWRQAVDSSSWFPEQEVVTPSMTTMSVRRLMPKNGGSPANSKAVAQSLALSESGNRAFIDTPLSRASSDKDCFLVCRPFSSPTSSKQNGGTFASQPSRVRELTPLEEPEMTQALDLSRSSAVSSQLAPVEESELPQVNPELDLKALAEESVLWLKDMSKLERSAAMADLKEWAKSAGLDWELWWQHFQQARQDSASPATSPAGSSKRQDRARAPRPHSLSNDSVFNPVPMQLKSYNDRVKSRSNISRAQVQSMAKHNAMATSPHTPAQKSGAQGVVASPGDLSSQMLDPTAQQGWNMARPRTDAEWHHLAVEALDWVQTKAKAERPAAMAQMRQWVVQMGIHWDKWWGYCLRLHADNKEAERALMRNRRAQEAGNRERAVAHQAPCLSSPCHSIQEDCSRDVEEAVHGERRSSQSSTPLDSSRTSSRQAPTKEEERERKRRWANDRKARDEAYAAQKEQWENNSQEKLVAAFREQWKKNSSAYTHEIFEKDT